MPQWLFTQIGNNPNPQFALQSSLNWIQALSFETIHAHGLTAMDQYNSALKQIKQSGVVPARDVNQLDLGELFGSLFRGITFTFALNSLVNSVPKAWTYPSAIVQWYYAVYNSLRAINIAQTFVLTDKHAALAKSLNNLTKFLPHPFNMRAQWQSAENYTCILPTPGHTDVYDLIKAFEEDSAKCRGMIVQYLKGTTKFELNKVKERLKEKSRIDNFKSAENRALRDRMAPRIINFLHCASRYRGKANYRDAIFLTYGDVDVRFDGRFVQALHNSARFANLMAFAYLKERVPGKHWKSFKTDLDENVRHINSIPQDDRYWKTLT